MLLGILNLISINSSGQLSAEIRKIRGIWIEKSYFDAFNEHRSAIKCENSFSEIYPVGLRVNEYEIVNDSFNIGFSYLHDHSLYEEISGCNSDTNTNCEQGYFRIAINQKSNEMYEGIEVRVKIANHINHHKGTITWNLNSEILTLKFDTFTISYKRFTERFTTQYLYPNPIYFFTRYKVAYGTYVLKDSLGNTLDEDFIITRNGQVLTEHAYFKDSKFHYSTDIYCGPSPPGDYCVFQIASKKNILFVIERDGIGNIKLYKSVSYSKNGLDLLKKSKVNYILIKKRLTPSTVNP